LKIPFLHIPDEIALENNKSARDNTDFVNDEIERLLQKGYISRVTQNTFVVNSLTVIINIILIFPLKTQICSVCMTNFQVVIGTF
jgi:hypothetical protein